MYQINYLDLKEKKYDDKYFFKLYISNNNKWEFFDYGWLRLVNDNGTINATFHANKTKILILNVSNICFNMVKKNDSDNHILIIINNVSYLLYNLYSQVIDLLFANCSNVK
jgi:hypothetical protein